MACQEAPVARRAYADAKSLYPQVYFLGIIGDSSHSVRKSGHNCGANRELVGTDPNYAHALDIGVGSDTKVGYDLVDRFIKDPRVWYVIYRGRGYRALHRGGGTFTSFDHESHVHISFGPGSTFQTQPFFSGAPSTPAWVIKEGTSDYLRTAALQHTLIKAGFDIPLTGVFDPTTTAAVKKLQGFLGATPSGSVGEWTMAAFENWVSYMQKTGSAPWVLTLGDKGGRVRHVNKILKRSFGQQVSSRKYTKKTQEAVKNAQAFLNLPVTGNVTTATYAALVDWDRFAQGVINSTDPGPDPSPVPTPDPVPADPIEPEPIVTPEARHNLRVAVDDYLSAIQAPAAVKNLDLGQKLEYAGDHLRVNRL